jgi:hypothetical protein
MLYVKNTYQGSNSRIFFFISANHRENHRTVKQKYLMFLISKLREDLVRTLYGSSPFLAPQNSPKKLYFYDDRIPALLA